VGSFCCSDGVERYIELYIFDRNDLMNAKIYSNAVDALQLEQAFHVNDKEYRHSLLKFCDLRREVGQDEVTQLLQPVPELA